MTHAVRSSLCILLLGLALNAVRPAAAHDAKQDTRPASLSVPEHWSFKPVVKPVQPPVTNGSWVRNPIDRFVLATLESRGIVPSPEADRVTLVRRLSLDLRGL